MLPNRVTSAQDLVRGASPHGIQAQLRVVGTRMRRYKRWLTQNHPYNGNVVQAVGTSRQPTNIDGPKLGEYIASSAPLHLADGWNYLSRAFDAASCGDRGSACHLSYYAELRAAMSILASEGIGIFNGWHIALDPNLNPTAQAGTTHEVAWRALLAWSQEAGRGSSILDAITVDSISVSDWLQSIGAGPRSQQAVADDWLNAWSIDLNTYLDDRTRRNETSYRPTRIRTPAPRSVDPGQEFFKPMSDCWSELQPDIVGVTAALDLGLLRRALRLVVSRGWCNSRSLRGALSPLRQDRSTAILDALRTERPSSAAIFRAAAIGDFDGKPVTPILARGLLMLRLASASTANLLAVAGISKDDLEFWWLPMGYDLGLWEATSDFATFPDLWTDVAEARDEADDRVAQIQDPSRVKSVVNILSGYPPLTQFTRAPLWLLDLD